VICFFRFWRDGSASLRFFSQIFFENPLVNRIQRDQVLTTVKCIIISLKAILIADQPEGYIKAFLIFSEDGNAGISSREMTAAPQRVDLKGHR
jgi:hypothetical protein